MENINARLIKPLKKGIIYVNPIKKMLNYEFMTDNEILLCVKKGYLSDKIFDWTEYNKAQKPVEDETPVVESVEETPVVESVEETPVVEPVTEETPVEETPTEKPKRSSKKGSK